MAHNNKTHRPSCKLMVALLSLTILSACQSPFLVFPGKALQGQVVQTTSFAFAANHALLKLEVNSNNPAAAPYSVFLRTTVIDGKLYVDAAKNRRWARALIEDQNVRLEIGGNLYEAIATPVTTSDVTERFLPNRTIYQLLPKQISP